MIKSFREFVENSLLTEMAFARKHARETITGISLPLARHLILFFAKPDEPAAKNHWIKEIDTFLDTIDDLSEIKGNKRLKYKDLEELLLTGPLDTQKDYENRLRQINKKYPYGLSYDREVHLKIKDILKEICKDISRDRYERTIRKYI